MCATTALSVASEGKASLWRAHLLRLGLLSPLCLAFQWPTAHPAFQIPWTLVTAYVLFCWSSGFHDTVHHTYRGSKRRSINVGRVLGTLMLVPYTVYRESHITHHAYLNTPDDWELWPYNDPRCSRRFRRVFVWCDLFFGVISSPWIYSRIYFHPDSPLKAPEVRRTIRHEYLAMALFWTGLFAVVAYFGAWQVFARTWVIPVSIAGVIQSWRKFTEHLGMRSYDPLLGTRTVIGPNWLTRLGSFLNFDIFVHGVHHRHPRLMHDSLVPKMTHYVGTNPEVAFPVFRSYWQAAGDVLPYLLWNPGCGMNVGAPPPEKGKVREVRDFVADVSTEILALHEVA